MDPLSIAASVVGLVTAGREMSLLLQQLIDAPSTAKTVSQEIDDFVIILAQLQPFVLGSVFANPDRTQMLDVEHIQVTLFGCVVTFSELSTVVNELCPSGRGLRGRFQWAWAGSTLAQLVQRLQSHKNSLTLILTILTCVALAQALAALNLLEHDVQDLIAYHAPMSPRAAPAAPTRSRTFLDRLRPQTTRCHAFDRALTHRALYQHASRSRLRLALFEPVSIPGAWPTTATTGPATLCSIAAVCLPISAAELSNPQSYTTATTAEVFPQGGGLWAPVEQMAVGVWSYMLRLLSPEEK